MITIKTLIRSVMTVELTDKRKIDFVPVEIADDYIRFESLNCIGEYSPLFEVRDRLRKLFSLFPKELQDEILETERFQFDEHGKIAVENVKLFLPSASEIFSGSDGYVDCYAEKGLYKQLDFYKDIHNRVRAEKDGSSRSQWYWTSSRMQGSPDKWCIVHCDGDFTFANVNSSFMGVAICFRLKKQGDVSLNLSIRNEE